MDQILQLILTGGLVAAILGLIGVLYSQRRATQRHREDLRQANELDAQRAKREKEAELEKQRADALERYLANMQTLLTDKQLRPPKKSLLRKAEADAEARASAEAQTRAVLQRLDPERKGSVLRFLYDAALIQGRAPVVGLGGSNLSGVNLSEANLGGANWVPPRLARSPSANHTEEDVSEVRLRDHQRYDRRP
jgi:hypothetical protein